MSRHLLLDRSDRQIVLGFDHPLSSIFGQVMRAERAIDGWPTRSGLGTRRPAVTAAQMLGDLADLTEWAKTLIPDEFAVEPLAAYHLGLLIGLLHSEWEAGRDLPGVPLPVCLGGERP